MPANLTYPGVYIEEIPSGVRTITGVQTSITAFLGRAARGPVNEPSTINGFGDFQRQFGGLNADSRMSYAVRDFFLNGGGEAVIVRLFNGDAAAGAVDVAIGEVKLIAISPGKWGTKLRITFDRNVSADMALAMGIPVASLFNLKVVDSSPGGSSEEFRNVTLEKSSSRRLDKVLADSSRLVKWNGANLDTAATPPALPPEAVKFDAVTDAEMALKAAIDSGSSTTAPKAALTAALAAVNAKGSDGAALQASDYLASGKKGVHALDDVDLFNILCLPPDMSGDIPGNVWDAAAAYCEQRRAMLIVDPPAAWNNVSAARTGVDALMTRSRNAAVYFPRLRQQDPLKSNALETFVPCGAVAGIFARTDNTRGVWKAPAGTEASLIGVQELSVPLTDPENGQLNPLGVNCLRAFPVIGHVVWGARTLRGADLLADEWKYLPVRRTALFIEESLFRGTQWVVFEPNDEPLWAQIRLNVGAFMHNLFLQGAFQGSTPQQAYLVKCDKETNPQADIDKGIVNIVVGFAPLKPAEFVIITIQQLAGQNTV